MFYVFCECYSWNKLNAPHCAFFRPAQLMPRPPPPFSSTAPSQSRFRCCCPFVVAFALSSRLHVAISLLRPSHSLDKLSRYLLFLGSQGIWVPRNIQKYSPPREINWMNAACRFSDFVVAFIFWRVCCFLFLFFCFFFCFIPSVKFPNEASESWLLLLLLWAVCLFVLLFNNTCGMRKSERERQREGASKLSPKQTNKHNFKGKCAFFDE